jgi:hypothetical protein
MLDPDDSCLACHKLPTMLSKDFVTRLSAHLTPWKKPTAVKAHNVSKKTLYRDDEH